MSNLRPRKERPDYKALSQGVKQTKVETPEEPAPQQVESEDTPVPSTSGVNPDRESPCREDFITPAQTEEERAFRFPSPELDSIDTKPDITETEVS